MAMLLLVKASYSVLAVLPAKTETCNLPFTVLVSSEWMNCRGSDEKVRLVSWE